MQLNYRAYHRLILVKGSQRDGDKCKDEVGHGVAPLPGSNFYPFESEAAYILGILKRVDSEIRRNDKSLAFKVMSVWGINGVGKSALVRSIYHVQMQSKYSHRWGKYAWVAVPHPFDLEEFYLRLLCDLCSITTEDEYEECHRSLFFKSVEDRCRDILREHRCLFVIDGLESVEQWKEINIRLKLGEAKGCTIVITNEENLAIHCAGNTKLVCNVKSSEHGITHRLSKDQGSQFERREHDDKVSHTVSPQFQDSFKLVCPRSEAALILLALRDVDIEFRDPNREGRNVMVWGIAGVGKSALVKSIYYNQMKFMYSHRWSKCGWVDVPHPFNLREFSRSLLLDLSSKSTTADKANEYYRMSSTEDPIKECRDILREHRCLIVIDDLRSIEDWASISTALELLSAKTRAIVITNEESIAIHCAKNTGLMLNIRSLEPDAALQLFKYQARVDLSALDPDIMKHVKLLLNKCGGLPKVIIAMCHLLAFVDDRIDTVEIRVWQYLNANFMPELEKRADSDGLQGLLVGVHKYFRSCPDLLKPCVFYLPIFPPNINIRRRRLLRRWIAEGYCRDSINATAEKNGDESLDKLVGLSMIQRPPQAIEMFEISMSFCQVNGFFREYIVSQPMEDNMVFALEERCSQNSQYTGRHLVIQSSWVRDIYLFESIDFSRLRSLTVFGEWRSFFISNKMKVLRVLDLEDTSDVTDDDVELIVKLLSHLKFLSLRGCKSVSRLPTSLGNLKQLETLDVRHTSVTLLPPTIINLQKLQYIRAGTTVPTQPRSKGSWLPKFCRRKFISAHLGVEAPRGIEKLKALDTLGVINVGVSGGEVILKELKNLTHVRKLGVSGINQENIKDFSSAIKALGHLESLSVRLDEDSQDFFRCFDDMSEPLKENLRSLKLYGHVDKLPDWINSFRNLIKLHLEMTILTMDMIDSLMYFPGLLSLRLCVKPILDDEHNFSLMDFSDLQVLEIDCSSRLLLTFGQNRLLNLELLKVRCSSGLKISGLAHLEKLKRVWLLGSYDDALKRDLESQLAKHPNEDKPVLQLEGQLAEHPNEDEPVLQLEEVSSDVETDTDSV